MRLGRKISRFFCKDSTHDYPACTSHNLTSFPTDRNNPTDKRTFASVGLFLSVGDFFCFYCQDSSSNSRTPYRPCRHVQRARISFRLIALCLLLTFISASALFADEAGSLFQQGNQSYQSGDYQKAVEAYEGILRLGRENWQVYYNLGNAYYKQQRTGKAILNYERALRLYPDNEDIRFNLDLANLQIADRIPVPPRSVVLVWLQNVLRFISLDGSAALALISWLALFAGLILSLMSRRGKGQQWGRTLAWSAGVLFTLFGCLFVYHYYDHQTSFGIVMAPRVIVRSSPAESATEVFILHEGAKARLETKTGDWMRIRLADGKVGWLPAVAVEKI